MRAPQPTPSRFRLFCDGLLRFITKCFAPCTSKNAAPDSESTDAGFSSPRASILPIESADARPVSLARAGLRHEGRRYLAAVLAITFASMLIAIQMGLLLGMFGTVSSVIDRSDAELWIGYRNTRSVDLGRAVSRFSDALAWQHPDVRRIERYVSGYADMRRADGVPVSVILNGIDATPQALAYARLLTPAQRAALDAPDAILIDRADEAKLQAAVGDTVEINGRRVRVAGIVDGIRAIGGVNVLASFATARRLMPEGGDQPTFLLVDLDPAADPAAVQAALADRARFPRYSVWTAAELSYESQAYWLLETGAGIGTAFASLLALIVGMVITSQTLSGAILASLKEFAALRALGVARAALRRVVIEQSFWVGVVGLGLAGALTALLAVVGHLAHVDMRYPWWMLLPLALTMLVVAVLSGLLALRPLNRVDPANLLR